jgi:hypothetical protein
MSEFEIIVRKADVSERPVIYRMLELYQHDLSDIWDQDIDSNGEYGYALDRFWSDAACHSFLVLVDSRYAGLLPARFLGCCPASSYGRSDAELFKLFAGFQRRRKPPRLQPTPRPRFRWVLRIAIFWGDCTPWAASNSFAVHSTHSDAIQFAELLLDGPALLSDFSAEDGIDLLSELR